MKFDPDSLKQVENPDRPLPRRSIRERGDDLVSQHPFREGQSAVYPMPVLTSQGGAAVSFLARITYLTRK